MISRDDWAPTEADTSDLLSECVYGSRLIGSSPELVLHGGGNTSVKDRYTDITGRQISALYVKGSGWDLATIERAGFAALPLDRLRELLALEQLSDRDMVGALSAAKLDAAAPEPSVETLLHAAIPDAAVIHSHADAIVTVTNTPGGRELVAEVLGNDVVVVDYTMPGFDLARAVASRIDEIVSRDAPGLVLMHHGLVTFGPSVRAAYERHLEVIDRARAWLDRRAPYRRPSGTPIPQADPLTTARLRRAVSDAAGRPMLLSTHRDPATKAFVERPDLESLAGRGPLTPDHVIYTKRVPLVGTDVAAYSAEYRSYVERHRGRVRGELVPIDPAPRVILDPDLGMLVVGARASDLAVVSDIYTQTIPVLVRAEDHLGGYAPLPEESAFDCEYWELEQAKLRRRGPLPQLAGQVALVTGAASGIGRACAAELLARGAVVAGLDVSADVATCFDDAGWTGIPTDVTDARAVADALQTVTSTYGGIDLAVVAAGIFGASAPVSAHDAQEWRRVFAVNVDSVAELLSQLHPLLVESPAQPAVVLVGSRNVPAPGQGASAYSASKAALTQLGRVTALEWAPAGIRVNTVHPDAVFDTALWSEDLLAERARHYGLTVEQYQRRNLLGRVVLSRDVAAVVAELCTERFAATTGAQVPVDGGSARVV